MKLEQLESRRLLAVDLAYSSYLGGDGIDNAFLVEVLDTGEMFVAGSTTSTDFTTTIGGDDSFGGGFVDVFVVKLAKSGKMIWSTYLGGNGFDLPTSIDSDAEGRLIVSGTTQSSDFDATVGKDDSLGGVQDAFLTRLDPSDGSVLWSTLVGGDEAEANPSAAVSPTGQWFVSGNTNSEDFPVGGGFDSSFGGGTGNDAQAESEGYVGLLNPNTGAMTKTSFIGGNGNDLMLARTFDTSGNLYFSFTTTSGNIPVTGGGFDSPNAGGQDAYVIKIDSAGGRTWSSVVGGSGDESTAGLTLDASDRPLLFSTTSSDDYPTTAGQDGTFGGETDATLFAFNANGGRRYATYIGGNGADTTIAIQVDLTTNAPLAMVQVESTNLTASGGFDNTNPDGQDHLLTRFSAAGAKEWSTYLGGAGTTEVAFFRPNTDGSVFVLGTTSDEDFTATGGFQTEIGGQVDAFVIRISQTGAREWSTFIGGESDEGFASIGFADTSLSLTMLLPTNSDDFDTKGGFQNSYGGGGDILAIRLTSAGQLDSASYFGGELAETLNVFRVDPNGDVLGVGTTQSEDYPRTADAKDKTHNGQHDVAIAKFSFGKAASPFFTVINGKLTIDGTGGDDTIIVRRDGDQLELVRGNDVESVDLADVDSIEINSGKGDDSITINSNVEINTTINTGKGDDAVKGGAGNDKINGGSGKDDLEGRAGADTLTGGAGRDTLAGGAGRDRFFAADGVKDILNGGKGRDRANEDDVDLIDELTKIEVT